MHPLFPHPLAHSCDDDPCLQTGVELERSTDRLSLVISVLEQLRVLQPQLAGELDRVLCHGRAVGLEGVVIQDSKFEVGPSVYRVV